MINEHIKKTIITSQIVSGSSWIISASIYDIIVGRHGMRTVYMEKYMVTQKKTPPCWVVYSLLFVLCVLLLLWWCACEQPLKQMKFDQNVINNYYHEWQWTKKSNKSKKSMGLQNGANTFHFFLFFVHCVLPSEHGVTKVYLSFPYINQGKDYKKSKKIKKVRKVKK